MRKSYLGLSFFFLFIGYLLNSVYRDYIYDTGIRDFGLADMGNNLIFVPGVYFLILLTRNKPFHSYFLDILHILVFYIAIELLQWVKVLPGTFDPQDIAALVAGAMLTYFISRRLHRF